jgi:hypothetical protein
MRIVLFLSLLGYLFPGFTQERPARPIEIDPNTKIEGGADVRGSGASAGASTRSEEKTDADKPRTQQREDAEQNRPEKDKPISARKPQEREDPSLTQDYLRQ